MQEWKMTDKDYRVWKMQDWKMTDKDYGVWEMTDKLLANCEHNGDAENARHENAAPECKGGKCET